MQKIPSLFQRNYETDRLVRDEVVPGSEWVLNGEGLATRKYDGMACMVKDGILYKRYDVKKNRKPPENGIPCEPKPNEKTGHWPFWLPIGDGPEDKYFRDAFLGDETDGTYELCGPKVQGNPEYLDRHILIPHGFNFLAHVPCNFEGIKEYLRDKDIEGVVWHHPDGRMVKIKKKDFGFKR